MMHICEYTSAPYSKPSRIFNETIYTVVRCKCVFMIETRWLWIKGEFVAFIYKGNEGNIDIIPDPDPYL